METTNKKAKNLGIFAKNFKDMYYKLIRHHQLDKAVYGKLCEVKTYFNNYSGKTCEQLTPICDTLENADYLIPPLIYKVVVTMSPKFGRLLPALQQVPGRTGIRFHRGCRPEHSEGCILVSRADEQMITARFLAEQTAREETRIEFINNF